METASETDFAPQSVIAAVDLGSNSFQVQLARATDGGLVVLDHVKESVRLAAGLGADRTLSDSARRRGLDCLRRFGERLRRLPPGRVRAVGTSTLRSARGLDGFLAEARLLLGHPVEIIDGLEEARLIYTGVVHDLGPGQTRRLVVDIGGGSTELIVGELDQPIHVQSLSLGVVARSRDDFPAGRISAAHWQQAVHAARARLAPLVRPYRQTGWDRAFGASGSIKAIGRVCAQAGWCADTITAAALETLGREISHAGHVDRLGFAGLSPSRRPIFLGGAVILTAVFESLGIREMAVSDRALRDGILLEMLARCQGQCRPDASGQP